MKRWSSASLLILLLASAALAQGGAEAPPAANTLVRATAVPLLVAAGSGGTVSVHLEIRAGWHVNANPPALDYLIPTRVSLAGAVGLDPAAALYPPPIKRKLSFEEQELWVWDGAVDVKIPVRAGAGATPGVHVLTGKVDFQSCNDQVCLAPTSVPFTVRITVAGGGPAVPADRGTRDSAASPSDSSLAAAPEVATTPTAPGGIGDWLRQIGRGFPGGGEDWQRRIERALARGGAGWLLLLFGGGLLLAFTPCVFPMLGITVSIFGARRKEPFARVFGNAVAYVLGISVMYSSLGVVAALTGGMFGAALQNPLVNIGLGVLLLGLSLSMFGVYEMQAPLWLLDRAGNANTRSALGIFLSGLAVGVVAAPCVGPFLVGVLAIIARRASPVFGFEAMFVLSLGLGFPFLLLATFTGLLQKLPRSGDWMDWVKKFFGVLMASIGLYYLLLGLLPRFATDVLPAALILGGLYLGYLEKSANDRRGFRLAKRAGGAVAVVAGAAIVLLATVAPSATSIVFRDYDESAVQASLAGGRGVMIDFTADWCVPCHEMDLATFPDPRVVAAARGFDAYRVDLTHADSPASEQHRRRFGVSGPPTIVFLKPGGAELTSLRVVGRMAAGPFAQRLAEASAALR